MRVGIVTLGCDKNTVDAEYLAGLLAEAGCDVVEMRPGQNCGPVDAAVLISCGFIADAREQSVEALVALAEMRKTRRGLRRLYVAGCLPQKHARDLESAVPEIDGMVGVGQYPELARMVVDDAPATRINPAPLVAITRPTPRRPLHPKPYAFLRVADGCNHGCAFCAIPQMKGPYRSTPPEVLLEEASALVRGGVRELNLVAQDITPYGTDVSGGYRLPQLLRDLCRIEGDFWIRCMYVHPGGITDALIETIAAEPKIVPYLDLPFQHFEPAMLRRMRRPSEKLDGPALVRRLRDAVPGLVLRTSLIVGYPGETIHSHRRMLAAMRDMRFERLGAFIYSREPDTPAASMPRQVGKRVAESRYHAVMALQAEISAQWQRSRVGRTFRVLIEDFDAERGMYIGRGHAEAPEVDGVVYVASRGGLRPGGFAWVTAMSSDVYDLTAACRQPPSEDNA